MIEVNLAAFSQAWRSWLVEQGQVALKVYRGLAAEMFKYMVHETPQYTGETVSNWTLAGKAPVYSLGTGEKEQYEASAPRGFREAFNKESGGERGPNLHAMDTALRNLHDGLASVKSIADPIFIVNATEWDNKGGNVDQIVRYQPSWLRDVNIQSPAPMQAARSYVLDRYSGALDKLQLSHLMRMAV